MKISQILLGVGILLLTVVFSPVILVCFLIDRVTYLFSLPKLKREYQQSDFYKDLAVPYKKNLMHSPEYRVYNSLKERNLSFRYENRPSDKIVYIVYQNILYVLPDFDQIIFDENTETWNADYDGDRRPLSKVYEEMVSKPEFKGQMLPVKLLVERRMFAETDLRGMEIPKDITLVRSYDRVFAEEDPELALMVPTDEEELYDMMRRTPGLCGKLLFPQEGPLVWDLYEDAELHIGVNPLDCCISVHRKGVSKVRNEITHWHSDIFEIYDEICELGKPGNVLAIRSTLLGKATYTGPWDNCPYKNGKNSLFRKVYYYEPKI